MWWRRKRSERDFSSELRAHIELEADQLQAQGLSRQEAFWQARKSFGNVLQAEERFYESQRAPWLDCLRQDIHYALRQLVRENTFTMVAAATLALGIGAATAIFTIVNATLVRALPYPNGDRIVSIEDVRLRGESTGGLVGVPRFFDLQARAKSFDATAFYYFAHLTMIAGASVPAPLDAVVVSGKFWDVLGVQPALGRTFNEKDGRPDVAVISYAVWQRLFGGHPSVINRQITLDGKAATIVGVLPQGVEYPRKIEVWRHAHFDPAAWTYRGNGSRFVNVLARLKGRHLISVGARGTAANWKPVTARAQRYG